MNEYTPFAYRVGPCTKCWEILTLQMPGPGADIDAILRGPRECPGYHVELAGWGEYFWPWRCWPEVVDAEAVEAIRETIKARRREGEYTTAKLEAVARGRARIGLDGYVIYNPVLRVPSRGAEEAA